MGCASGWVLYLLRDLAASGGCLLEPGDSLLFDSDAPHGPEGLVQLPARYLSIITYPQAR